MEKHFFRAHIYIHRVTTPRELLMKSNNVFLMGLLKVESRGREGRGREFCEITEVILDQVSEVQGLPKCYMAPMCSVLYGIIFQNASDERRDWRFSKLVLDFQ